VTVDAIVVAAGSSTRMGGRDKLGALVAGRPLLAWSVGALADTPEVERIVVVTSSGRVAGLRSADWLPDRVVAVVAGGERRQESVARGLAELERLDADAGLDDAATADRIVLVHDGARPLATPGLARRVAEAAGRHGAAIPVVPVAETLKRVAGEQVVETVERSSLAAAQTPQGVRRGLLREAFRRFPPDGPRTWTDEAALLEACRIVVHAIPGEPANLKVTVPADLVTAEFVLGGGPGLRTGIGHDSHPFGPGAPLVLAGVSIPGAPRLRGHSDGDVALHAVADALLGAAGLGDLGRLFPAGPATPEGVSSGDLVREAVSLVRSAGYRPRSVDLTLVGARPRLVEHLPAMAAAAAGLLGLDPGAVNVKASSGNLSGDEGAGRGMAALAIATVEQAR
jgi:2-C-methyl-D-erythritol 4-phosphate cytidylyltransferase/2-C-methyl-D-erythritol 2,4-cyclodiphosphate synthase